MRTLVRHPYRAAIVIALASAAWAATPEVVEPPPNAPAAVEWNAQAGRLSLRYHGGVILEATVGAEDAAGRAAPKPLKVFVLAGQSNMDGQANVSTIDFLGEDKEHGYLLKKFKPDGKTLVTRDDVWVAHRGVYGKLGPGYGGRRQGAIWQLGGLSPRGR